MRKNDLPAALILAFLFLMEGFLSGCHASEPAAEEEILCGGDGKYVAVRCVKGEDGKPLYTLGTIDPKGNVVDEFRPYTQAEGFGQNISAGIFHKSLRIFDETIVDTTLPYDPDELMFRFFEHGYFQKSGSLYKVS